MGKTKVIVVTVILIVIGYFVWNERNLREIAEKSKEDAEMQLGLESARLLNAKFITSSQLKVATDSLELSGYAEYNGTVFKSSQTIKAPVSVDYFVNLREISKNSYYFSSADNILTVSIPDVNIAKPNIDFGRAKINQKGVWISREAGIEMNKTAYRNIANKASEHAKSDEQITKARESARSEISKFVQQALDSTQRSKIRIAISFPWEPKPTSGKLEVWDITRTPQEVMADKSNANANQ